MNKPAALGTTVIAAYALPQFSQSLIHGPVGAIIQGIYAQEFGLSLAAIATVLLVASIVDAAVNPVVGYASDRYRLAGGSRKPWIFAGTLVCMAATWFLYAPAPPVTAGYFMAWLVLAYVGWALVEVPHAAWMPEITANYDERTRLATWRAVAAYLGITAFMAIPYLPFLSTSTFSAESLRWTAIVALVALPTFALIALTVVPSAAPVHATPAAVPRIEWRGVLQNRPLHIFALAFLLYQLAPGVLNGVLFFYVVIHLGQGKLMAGLMLMTVVAALISIPAWGWLCRRIGKHRAWALSCVMGAMLIPCYALVPEGPQGTILLALVQLGVVVSFAVFPVAAPAVLADVIDYARLRYGADYGGSYFAIYNVFYKSLANVGGAVALAAAGFAGFNPQATTQSSGATAALIVIFSVVPAVLLALAAPLIWRFPIDARRQATIAKRLASRDARATASAAVTSSGAVAPAPGA
jgi:GPH family glycoside/pentoside/hexuronide:cation symporter